MRIKSNDIKELRRSGELITRLQETKFYPCANVAAVGSCGLGHTFGKLIPCGKEWCEYCGEKHSLSHERRIDRWRHKVNEISSLGYMVVTLPGEIAEILEREDLIDFSRALVRYLKRDHNIDRGLYRWHWCGDCRKCKGAGCDHCEYKGTGKKFHPHINLLFERGYMDKKDIEAIKIFVAKWWKNRRAYEYEKAVIHYQYTTDENEKKHKLNYVTRATLRFPGLAMKYKKIKPDKLQENDFERSQTIAEFIKGFRSTNTWGQWDKKPAPDIQAADNIELLNSRVCPCCAENSGEVQKIHYKKRPVFIRDFYQSDHVKYKKGWFFLPENIVPGEAPDVVKEKERERQYIELQKRKNLLKAAAVSGVTSYEYLLKLNGLHPEQLKDINSQDEKPGDIFNQRELFNND